jgi:hypothetical protein
VERTKRNPWLILMTLALLMCVAVCLSDMFVPVWVNMWVMIFSVR